MPARIATRCAAHRSSPPPDSRRGLVRCILDSLALAHRRTVRDAAALSGCTVERSTWSAAARNALLCQLTADACGLPVVAGPVEATAIGNVLVAARALGALGGGLADLRAFLAEHVTTETFEPAGTGRWDDLEAVLHR